MPFNPKMAVINKDIPKVVREKLDPSLNNPIQDNDSGEINIKFTVCLFHSNFLISFLLFIYYFSQFSQLYCLLLILFTYHIKSYPITLHYLNSQHMHVLTLSRPKLYQDIALQGVLSNDHKEPSRIFYEQCVQKAGAFKLGWCRLHLHSINSINVI